MGWFPMVGLVLISACHLGPKPVLQVDQAEHCGSYDRSRTRTLRYHLGSGEGPFCWSGLV